MAQKLKFIDNFGLFGSSALGSLVSRSIFFDLTDLDRPRAQPTRPRSTFDLKNLDYIALFILYKE